MVADLSTESRSQSVGRQRDLDRPQATSQNLSSLTVPRNASLEVFRRELSNSVHADPRAIARRPSGRLGLAAERDAQIPSRDKRVGVVENALSRLYGKEQGLAISRAAHALGEIDPEIIHPEGRAYDPVARANLEAHLALLSKVTGFSRAVILNAAYGESTAAYDQNSKIPHGFILRRMVQLAKTRS